MVAVISGTRLPSLLPSLAVIAPKAPVAQDGPGGRASQTNWNSKVTINPARVYTPTSENEIVAIMKSEKSVRVVGGLHSFNGALSPDAAGALVNMVNFNRVSDPVCHPNGQYSVWVQPGATIAQVQSALYRHGLALEHLPTSEDITIGGAVANGAHGSGLTSRACISEQVIGMTIVTSDGTKETVAPERLPLYRINMGSLGVVSGIELRCVKDFDLITKDDTITGESELMAHLEPSRLRDEVSAYQNVMYIVNPDLRDPANTKLTRWGLEKVTDENRAAAEAPNVVRKYIYEKPSHLDEFAITKAYAAMAAATGPQEHDIKKFLRDRWVPRPVTVGRSALMYQTWLDHPSHDVSYAVPLDKAQIAMQRTLAKLRELGFESEIPLSMRFLRGTHDTLLAMNSGGDVATIELVTSVLCDDPKTGALRPEVKRAEDEFEKIMIELGGRPHWGKEYTVKPKDRYARDAWEQFGRESVRGGSKLINTYQVAMTPARKA